jgi:hypothetical protein
MGRLTNRPAWAMIHGVRRGEPSVEPNPLPPSPRAGNPRTAPVLSIRWTVEQKPVAKPRRAPQAPARRATRRNRNAPENHDHVGRGPVRRNAPTSAPRRYIRSTLLQHERLHQLSHRRFREGPCPLRDLRLHPPAPLSPGPSCGVSRPAPPRRLPGQRPDPKSTRRALCRIFTRGLLGPIGRRNRRYRTSG